MPIPDFDHNQVLPPHLGDPTLPDHLSPYCCSILELCERFSTSRERIEILKGLISFRKKMNEFGIIHGYQWLDGSFIENIEVTENRPPRDIDVVTLYSGLSLPQTEIIRVFPEFISSEQAKKNFKVDHYPFDISYNPNVTVQFTRYWIQLFTHNRKNVWKGIIQMEINTPVEDENAMDFLNSV